MIDKGKRGACSGVLIEPDLVLTAAHCLFGPKQNGRLKTDNIVFRTGAYPGRPSVERGVAEFVRHPLFLAAQRAGQPENRFDFGLVRLDAAVPEYVARPLAVREIEAAVGDTLLIASFPRGRGERARERRCPILATAPDLLLVECVVVSGESGAPVLWRDGETWVVGAVLLATSTINGRPAGLAARQVGDRIDAMKPMLGAS